MKAFLHNYTEPITANQVHEIAGYTKALRALSDQIAAMTEFKPEKRMIDACELLDMIPATLQQLEPLMKSFKANLESGSFNDRNTLETTHY